MSDGVAEKDLGARHQSESQFHDAKYGEGDHYPKHYAVNPTYPVYQAMLEMAGDLDGSRVLEYGCGEGWITRDLVRSGAEVCAFDISEEAVRKTQQVVEREGARRHCEVRRMGAERLDYPDASFDCAIGFAILHHLDLQLATDELYRVLKPGGVAFFAEPVAGNPLLDLYRHLTPQYRTRDEAPLDLKRFLPTLGQFREVRHQEYYLTALAGLGLIYLPLGQRLYGAINPRLMRLDERLLKRFPALGRWAWYTVLTLSK